MIDDPLQGYQIGRIVFGGSPSNVGDDVEVRDGFEGCVKVDLYFVLFRQNCDLVSIR